MLSTSRPTAVCGAADSAAGCQGWRSQTKGESEGMTGRSLLQTRQRKLFPAPQKPASPSSFISAAFTSHTGSLLLSLYAPRYCLTASAGFGRQFAKLRALSRLRRRYDSRKYRPLRPFRLPRLPVLTPDTPSARARSARADSGRCRTWPCPGSAPDSCRIPRGVRRGYRPKSPG